LFAVQIMKSYLALCILLGASTVYAGEEALRTAVQTHDAERFAALFTAGKVSAAELQSGYLDNAGRGVQIFTPHRIQNAANLAKQVAKRKADYAHAIDTCLPVADSLNAELRAIYLAYRGLLPDLPLPRVYLVFGAGNSGGTAEADAQVLGLEVLCKEGTTVPQFRATMRRFFAHETVHTWQKPPSGPVPDRLLLYALMEGVPDLLSELVTGLEPDPAREAWARHREADIWQRFLEDRVTVQTGDEKQSRAAIQRWFGNAGQRFENLPEGWPGELGYWVGRNVARAYLAKVTDQREALLKLISAQDPAEILQASGYAPR
jgi:hypothetical protein